MTESQEKEGKKGGRRKKGEKKPRSSRTEEGKKGKKAKSVRMSHSGKVRLYKQAGGIFYFPSRGISRYGFFFWKCNRYGRVIQQLLQTLRYFYSPFFVARLSLSSPPRALFPVPRPSLSLLFLHFFAREPIHPKMTTRTWRL